MRMYIQFKNINSNNIMINRTILIMKQNSRKKTFEVYFFVGFLNDKCKVKLTCQNNCIFDCIFTEWLKN